MAREYDALAVVLLGVDVNAADEDGVAAVEEHEEDEATDVGDPAGQLRVVRDQPEVQDVPDAAPYVHRAEEAEQQEAVRDYQTRQTLKPCAHVPHQRLQGERHGHYRVTDGLQFNK